jgi:hypothetical protein
MGGAVGIRGLLGCFREDSMRATTGTVAGIATILILVAGGTGGAQLTVEDLGETVKLKVLVDKVMQPEADLHTEEWMVEEAAEAGFNVFCPHRANDLTEVRQVTEWCDENGILHIPWMWFTKPIRLDHPSGEGKRAVWASGVEDTLWSPNSDEFWRWFMRDIVDYARISAEMPGLIGVFLDFENYRKGPNCYELSYDDTIMQRFAEARGIELPELAFDERYPWLVEQGLHDDFEAFQVAHWRERCRALREAVDEHNPEFVFMVYPAPGTKFIREACYPEWATERASLILADAVTYGRPARMNQRDALAVNQEILQERRQKAMASGANLLYTGGIDPIVMGADAEFSGRNAAAIAEVTDGYWVFYEGKVVSYDDNHPEYFRWFAEANEAIRERNWNWAREKRETPDPMAVRKLQIEHPERIQIIAYGLREPLQEMLRADERYELHEMNGVSAEYFSGADVVLLQDFREKTLEILRGFEQLPRTQPMVKALAEYVADGGGLLLAHDTGWFIESPFPQIAERGSPDTWKPEDPAAQGWSRDAQRRRYQMRHVMDAELVIEDVDHPAIGGLAAGTGFTPEHNDHMIFEPGPQGTVLVRDEHGNPVYVAGEAGEGRVIYSGSFYGASEAPQGPERELLGSMLEWLAGG